MWKPEANVPIRTLLKQIQELLNLTTQENGYAFKTQTVANLPDEFFHSSL